MPITIYPGTVKKRNLNGTYSDLVPGADANPQLANDIAEEYDPVAGVYSVGDYCIYQSVLYKCITAISTPEAFNSTKWTDVSVTDEIGGVKNTLNQLDQNMAYVESGNTASRTYVIGDFISWKGTLYKANQSIPAATSFSTGAGGNLNLVSGNGGGLNVLNSLDGLVKNTGELTFVSEAFGYQYNASTILATLPLPFVAYNTNYTVTLSSVSIVGKGSQSLSNVTVDSKGFGYIRLSIAYSGSVNTPYLVVATFKIQF